jgi:hypothetical protein
MEKVAPLPFGGGVFLLCRHKKKYAPLTKLAQQFRLDPL